MRRAHLAEWQAYKFALRPAVCGIALALTSTACTARDNSALRPMQGQLEPGVTSAATSTTVATPKPSDSPASGGAAQAGEATPACEDPMLDSGGALDLSTVAVDVTADRFLVTYNFVGEPPSVGTVLYSVTAGEKQYGYKLVNGRESSHFVFDSATGQQQDVSAGSEVVRPTEVTFEYPLVSSPDSLFGALAAVNVDGEDIDDCRL